MDDEIEDFNSEWTRYQIQLPEDDFDEDDEMDARIAKTEANRRNHINRGRGIRGV